MKFCLIWNLIGSQDPAIASNKTLQANYPALEVGMNRDIFVKVNGTYLEGKVNDTKSFTDYSVN